MTRSRRGSTHLKLLLATLAWALPALALGQPAPSFDAVAELFDRHCTMCHQSEGAPLGLRLTTHQEVMAGSDRGAVVQPGDPGGSELVRRLRGTSQPRMPLTGPPYLDDAEIARVVAWIEAGAPAPAGDDAAPADEGAAGNEEVAPADEEDPTPDDAADQDPFAAVGAILARNCVRCHAPDGLMGAPPEGLVLTDHAEVVSGGERTVVVPGSPLASELYRRVAGLSRPRMPLDGPPYLDDTTIARIRGWIADGAPGPDGAATPVATGARLRLHGTLTGRWELDGLPLITDSRTRIDDRPEEGDFVEVRGVPTPEGGVRATRIRTR